MKYKKKLAILLATQAFFVMPVFAHDAPVEVPATELVPASTTKQVDEITIDEVRDKEQKNATAGEEVIEVDACPALVKITTKHVKYVGLTKENEHLFLDEEGYRVKPCETKEKAVAFFRIKKYPSGIELFKQSQNAILNESYYDQIIKMDLDSSYKITYGSNKFEVTNIHDFQKQLNLGNIDAQKDNSGIEVSLDEQEAMKKFFVLNDEITKKIPEEHKNDIMEEKTEIIADRYKMLDAKLAQMATQMKESGIMAATGYAVENNRFITPSWEIINQYKQDPKFVASPFGAKPEGQFGEAMQALNNAVDFALGNTAATELKENEEKEKRGKEDIIDGRLFTLYYNMTATSRYLQAARSFLADALTDPQKPLDERFATALNLSGDEKMMTFINQGKEYEESLQKNWDNNFQKLQALNASGIERYESLSDEQKKAFNGFLSNVNTKIKEKEYEQLPAGISRKQYKALSNIDKFKYAPKKDGNFMDFDHYQKIPFDTVIQYTAK